MARRTIVIPMLCAWMTILTLLPLYLLLSGTYKLIRNDKDDLIPASQMKEYERGVPWNDNMADLEAKDLRHLKRGVYIPTENDLGAEDSLSVHGNTHSYNKAIQTISSSSIRNELKKVLSQDESSNQRAAFDKVIALSTLLPKIANISRIKTPTPEAFRNYIAPMGLPVIFTDMLEREMLGAWTWDYVRSKWGDIVFHNTRQGNYSTKTTKSGKHFVNRVSVKFADFIDIVTGKRKPTDSQKGMYITKQRVIPVEALEAEFHYPPFYPGAHKKCYLEPTGWIGAPGTFTQGHIDSKDNFVYQVIGEKRWTIFSPQDYKYLYYTKTKGSLEWSSVLNIFDLEHPDLDKYPLYEKATPITFTMKPGEVLYLPRGWTHTVANVSPALMINVWRYGPAAITEYWSEKNREEIRKRCF